MSESVSVTIDGVTYKVHPDGDVFRVNGGLFGDATRKVGTIPPSTPQNKLEEKIRDLPNR